MPIRRDKDGRYHAEVCVGRRRLHRRLPVGATAGDAKRVEAELTRALHADATPRAIVIPGDPLLTELLADYTERHALTLRSPSTAQHHAYRIGRWCEGKRASDTRRVVSAIVQDMTGHYAAATINRSLSALRKSLRMAWERGNVTQDYSGLCKPLPERNARTTTLTMDEVRKIADCASPAARAGIWLALLTGCRRGEVLALQPDMIGTDTILLPAGATKTERAREVPIIPPMRPWLAHVPIPLKFEGLKSAFRRAREKAGMPHVQYRDLRRSCGTLLIREGVPLHVVSRILGHGSTTVTERVYAHLASQQVHDGMAALTRLHQQFSPEEQTAPKGRLSA